MTDLPAVELREPAHRVSPRAVSYWRMAALLGDGLVCLAVLGAWLAFRPPWWGTLLLVGVLVAAAVHVLVMPVVRYRVHRWEITPTAVHTRSGWLATQTRIAPLSRVQTVDSRQGALMRGFRLASLTVTTASAAGPITIDCLDQEQARLVVAQLTEVTGASQGDAT